MFGWPLDENEIRRNMVNHTFGLVRRNSAGQRKAHQGWDFRAKPGTPCYAIAPGEVVMIYESGDYGLVLVASFEHNGKTLYAAYAHLSKVLSKVGDKLSKGTVIAKTGESGNARGMASPDQHLHFEIRTVPRPGPGLGGRKSPLEVFGHCPLNAPVMRVTA